MSSDDESYMFSGSDSEYEYEDEDSSIAEEPKDTILPFQPSFFNLKETDIQRRLEDAVTSVSTILSVSKAESTLLLLHYNWNVAEVHEEWFADEERTRKSAGLVEDAAAIDVNVSATDKMLCKICYEVYDREKFISLSCCHTFCNDCWLQFVTIGIDDGPRCLKLRCPEPSCKVVVSKDMIDSLVSDEYKKKYSKNLIRSYLEQNKNIKWCPAPGCEFAVELNSGSEIWNVRCECSFEFCWNCQQEVHRPSDCETVSKWMLKTNSEGENVSWILANTKNCPKCNKSIEKNRGCMHMKCAAPCGHEFCWLCLGNWKIHGSTTGGFYSCNRYEEEKEKGNYSEEEKIREAAKKALNRYTHYFERWNSNRLSRIKALKDLKQIKEEKLNKLSDMFRTPTSQLTHITDAWLQISECRRVLQWTYASGFYMPEEEEEKKIFFEYLQGNAESGLERLHQLAEETFNRFFDDEETERCENEDLEEKFRKRYQEFHEFSMKLFDLTKVTKTYFQNLVNALENHLEM